MTMSLKDVGLEPVLRSLSQALLWALTGIGAVALMLLAVLAWSGILVW